jgi:hypothetical protein
MAFFRKSASSEKKTHVTKDGHNHLFYSPTGKGFSDIRIFPAPVADGTFQPQIVPVDGDPLSGLSDSFCEVELVSWFGENKETFITSCSDVEDGIPSPTRILYNAVSDFVESETQKIVQQGAGMPHPALPHWNKAVKSKTSTVSLPSTRMLFQCALLQHQGKPCVDKKGAAIVRMPVIYCLNRSATRALEEMLIEKIDTAADISAQNSVIGDITDIQNGAIVRVEQYINSDNQKRYKVTNTTQIYPLDPNQIRSMFVPWENLLAINTAQWQIDKLVKCVGPEMVDYALSNNMHYGEMVPAEVRGAFERAFGGFQNPGMTATQGAIPPQVPPPQQVAQAPAPQQVAPAPQGVAPAPAPQQVAPAPAPQGVAPAPAPAPAPQGVAPAPAPAPQGGTSAYMQSAMNNLDTDDVPL